MTQVQLTDQQLNRVLAEKMGYSVVLRGERFVLLNPNGQRNWHVTFCDDEQEAWLHTPDYCTDPAASLEVQTKALEVDTGQYLINLSKVIKADTSFEGLHIRFPNLDETIKQMLLASPRERAEAAYITLRGETHE
jgi:hypothetical protein